MKVDLRPGKYVVAVSGGVDSMVLLHMLAGRPDLQLTVAHFDHGMRADSDSDRQLVAATTHHYGLPFVSEQGHLGPNASEAQAREARYAFLRRAARLAGAEAIVTAHHQDDVIETGIINMLRGTGRKGLSALASTADIIRPLLHISKKQLLTYAGQHPDITWHEDSTNQDDSYLRNYVRLHIMPILGDNGRRQLLDYIEHAAVSNTIIDQILLQEIDCQPKARLQRYWFIMLPYDVSCEVMAAWLRQQGIRAFDRMMIHRLVVGAKVALPGKHLDINAEYFMKVRKTSLLLTPRTSS